MWSSLPGSDHTSILHQTRNTHTVRAWLRREILGPKLGLLRGAKDCLLLEDSCVEQIPVKEVISSWLLDSWALVPFIHSSALGRHSWAMNTQPGLHTRDIGFWLTGSLADQAASASAWGHSTDTVLRGLLFSQWLQRKNVDSTRKFSPFLVGYPWPKQDPLRVKGQGSLTTWGHPLRLYQRLWTYDGWRPGDNKVLQT